MRPIANIRRPAAGTGETQDELDGGTAGATSWDRLRDWRDHPAWSAFFGRYDPVFRRWCGRFGLDAESSDEVCQRIWIELMERLRTFHDDPGPGFHGWLWSLFRSRAIDWLRRRQASCIRSLETVSCGESRLIHEGRDRTDEADEPEGRLMPSILVRQAEAAQEAVRSRVDPATWRAYWMIAIEDRPIREAADSLGKTYTAAYTGSRRVHRMLRAEGQRRLAALRDQATAFREFD